MSLDASMPRHAPSGFKLHMLKNTFTNSSFVMCRIHQHNVEAVMLCILPYHSTGQFVRVLQILHIQNTVWAFMQPAQKSGAPVPRSSLVQRCQRDRVRPPDTACHVHVDWDMLQGVLAWGLVMALIMSALRCNASHGPLRSGLCDL